MTKQKRLVLSIVMLSYFVTAIDCSIIFTGVTKIADDLCLNQSALSWIQNVYVLAYGGFMLLGGRLSDSIGRKRILNLSLVMFCIGSFFAGAAPNYIVMIFARFLQGIGAAILAPTSLALLMDYFTGEERVTAIAWYSSVSGLGMCVGLILGGTFARFLSWRYGFFVNVPLTLIMLLISLRILSKTEIHRTSFDVTGTIFSVIGVFSFVYAINGAKYSWLWIVIFVICIIIFVRIEKKAIMPILPLSLFSSGYRTRAYIARILFAGSMMGFYFFVSEYLQKIFNFTPLQVSFAFFPLTVFTFIGAMLVPRMVNKYGDMKVLFIGLLLLLIGFVCTIYLHSKSYWLDIAIPMVLIGIGQGLATSPMTNLGIKNVEIKDAGAASGLVNASHQIGCSIGLSIMVAFSSNAPDMTVSYHISMIVAFFLILIALIVTFLNHLIDKLKTTY